MQVHDRPQGAPVLALEGDPVSVKRMQNHAPYACMAFIRKNGGFSEIFKRATARPVLHDGGCNSGSVQACIFHDYHRAKPRQA